MKKQFSINFEPLIIYFFISFLLHISVFVINSLTHKRKIELNEYNLVSIVNLDNFKKNFGSNKISTSVSNISKSNYNFIVSKNKIIATKPSLETQPNQEIVKESNSVNESALTEENTESGYGINETANFSDYVPSFKVAQLPRFINRVNPIYPETEKLSGKESEVLAEVYIDEKGNPRKVVILRSGGELFDKSVIDAVSKSKFSPAITTDGKIIPVRIRIPFKFELD